MRTRFIIYKIYWPHKGFYYGKTRGFRKRRNRHLREMANGTHHNRNLVDMWGKYGDPIIKICAYAHSDEELAVKEKAFLNLYEKSPKCLNIYYN